MLICTKRIPSCCGEHHRSVTRTFLIRLSFVDVLQLFWNLYNLGLSLIFFATCCVHMLSLQSDVLLEKGEIKADEIWKIYNSSPRIPQVSSHLIFLNKIILKFLLIFKHMIFHLLVFRYLP